MQTRFTNGFMVLVCPDRIFKDAVNKKATTEAMFSLFIITMILVPLFINIFKEVRIPSLNVTFSTIILMMFSMFFGLVLFTAGISWFFNWLYSLAIERRGGLVASDFKGNFLCHINVIPYWVMICVLHSIFYGKEVQIWWVLLSVLFTIRLLDIEARLIKVVYRMRLIQGYTVVLAQLLLIGLGMGMGSFIVTFLD